MKKIQKLKFLIEDLKDLKNCYESLNHAELIEDAERINEIKKSINDFDKNAMIKQLIEIME